MLICCLSLYGCQKYPVPSLDKTSFFESNDPNIWFKNTLESGFIGGGFVGEIIIGETVYELYMHFNWKTGVVKFYPVEYYPPNIDELVYSVYDGHYSYEDEEYFSGKYKTYSNKVVVSDIIYENEEFDLGEQEITFLKKKFSDSYLYPSTDNIQIDEGTTYIDKMAFYGQNEILNINIPSSVTEIKKYAFGEMSANIIFNEDINLTTIRRSAFREYLGTNIVIPNSVTTIEEFAFQNCINLQSITLPINLNSISDMAFYGLTSLQSIIIPSEVTHIGKLAFHRGLGLTEVILPNNLVSIDEYAFSFCDSLESIIIPESVTSMGANVFRGCNNLTIYCEANSQPSGWDSDWNKRDIPVVWGYTD